MGLSNLVLSYIKLLKKQIRNCSEISLKIFAFFWQVLQDFLYMLFLKREYIPLRNLLQLLKKMTHFLQQETATISTASINFVTKSRNKKSDDFISYDFKLESPSWNRWKGGWRNSRQCSAD